MPSRNPRLKLQDEVTTDIREKPVHKALEEFSDISRRDTDPGCLDVNQVSENDFADLSKE